MKGWITGDAARVFVFCASVRSTQSPASFACAMSAETAAECCSCRNSARWSSAEWSRPSMQKKQPRDNVAKYKERPDCAEDDVSNQTQLPFLWNGVDFAPNLSQFVQKFGMPVIINCQISRSGTCHQHNWSIVLSSPTRLIGAVHRRTGVGPDANGTPRLRRR
jgi:hypothetical protein